MATDMATGFDPYRAWLNVHEVRRPLNAYQLLGLSADEEDPEEIHNAGSMKRASLEAYRNDAPPEIWQQLYDELEQAIEILLDPDKKRAYDHNLNQPSDGRKQQIIPPGAVTRDSRGTTLVCGHCGAVNPAGRRFCGNCGKNLWEACVNCGTVSPVGERFCGACGGDLTAMVQEQIDRFDADMLDVGRLRSESRFDEAISLLGGMSRVDHPLLAGHAAKARQTIKEIAAERDERLRGAEELHATAQQYFDERNYKAAVEAARRVAEPLRSEALEELLSKAEQTYTELTALDADLRKAVESKQGNGLLTKIERLLEIKPDHAQALKAARVLSEKLYKVGAARLKQFRYDEALKVLDQIPASTLTPQTQRLHDLASELSWLSWDLQKAPVVTPALLSVAERLHKRAPGDPRAGKLLEELQRRIKRVDSEIRRTPLPWAAVPEKTYLGYPVSWLTGFERIQPKEKFDSSRLVEMPGRFAVACGLALQAVGAASVRVNLMPKDHGNMLSRVSRIIRKWPIHTAWGLDLGAAGLKAVKLTADNNESHVILEECEAIEHKKVLSQAANEIEEGRILGETLKMFLDKHPLRGERIAVAVSGRLVLGRHLVLPPGDPKALARAVEFEASHQIPHPLDQLVWGYEKLDEMHGGQPSEEARQVLLLAAKRDVLEKQLARFERFNLPVDVVQADSLALYNFFAHEFFSGAADDSREESNGWPLDPDQLTAVLEVGHDSTDIVVAGPNTVWFRNLGLGGHAFTRALVQEFQFTFAEAEKVKRDPFSTPSLGRICQALQSVMGELATEIHRSFESFERTEQRGKVTRVMGCGGGFQLHGLLRFLQTGR